MFKCSFSAPRWQDGEEHLGLSEQVKLVYVIPIVNNMLYFNLFIQMFIKLLDNF